MLSLLLSHNNTIIIVGDFKVDFMGGSNGKTDLLNLRRLILSKLYSVPVLLFTQFFYLNVITLYILHS